MTKTFEGDSAVRLRCSRVPEAEMGSIVLVELTDSTLVDENPATGPDGKSPTGTVIRTLNQQCAAAIATLPTHPNHERTSR